MKIDTGIIKDGNKEGQTPYTEKDRQKMKLIFFMGTQWRLHCRSLKSLLNASLDLKGGGVGKGEQGMGLCYLCFGTLCFSFLPHQNIFFFCLHQMSS